MAKGSEKTKMKNKSSSRFRVINAPGTRVSLAYMEFWGTDDAY
jgi:hypothetical protein